MSSTKSNLEFTKKLRLSDKEDVYLMQVFVNWDKTKIVCLTSDKQIHLFNDRLDITAHTKLEKPHKDFLINEISLYKKEPYKLVTCADDGKIKIWNLCNFDEAETILDYSIDKIRFLSIDINCDDSLLAASTANTKNNETFVYLFDLKNLKLLKKYSDAHSDDITQVRFDSLNPYRMLTASMDGLACHFELQSLTFETTDLGNVVSKINLKEESDDPDDDLIESVYNIDASIQKIGFLNSNKFYAITFTNKLTIYDFETQDLLFKLDLNEEKDKFNQCDYIVDCISYKDTLAMCLGKYDGSMDIYVQESRQLSNLNKVNNKCKKHDDVVRSLYFDGKFMYTGGEDGLLVKWKFDEVTINKRKLDNNDDNHELNEIKKNRKKEIL